MKAALHILLYLALLSSISIKLVVCGLGDNSEDNSEPNSTDSPATTNNGFDPTGGLSVGITNNELNHIAEIGAKIMEKEITGHRIDRVNIDSIAVEMTDLEVKSLKIPNASISTNSSKLRPSVAMDTNLTTNWKFCFSFLGGRICDSGSADLCSTASLSTDMNVTVKNGDYDLDLDQCESLIDDYQAIIKESYFSGLYNMILPWFKEPIKQELQEKICPQVKNEVKNRSSDVMYSFRKNMCVDDLTCIDFSLTNSPVVNEDFVATPLKGEFVSQINQTVHHFNPSHIKLSPPVNQTHCNYYFHATEYTVNTALDVYFQSGRMQFAFCYPRLFKSLLPKRFLKVMALLSCETSEFTGNMQPAEECSDDYLVYINTTSNPTAKISPSQLSINFSVTFNLVKERTSLCAMNFVAMAGVNVSINSTRTGHNITGVVNSFHIPLSDDDLCPLLRVALTSQKKKLASVASLLDAMADKLVVPSLNAKLERGFSLPELEHILLIHPSIHLSDGYVTTCFDVDYRP